MIKTVTGALRAIKACQTADALRLLWAEISHVAWNDNGSIRAAYEAKRDAFSAGDALDYEHRWLTECRAHGETRRRLARAQHELGDHSLCSDCEDDGEPDDAWAGGFADNH